MESFIYPWHEEIWEQIQRMSGKLPHALLFHGPAGTGIESFSEYLAKSILCEDRLPGGRPCCRCGACRWFGQRNHPDYRILLPEELADAMGIELPDEEGSPAKTSKTPSKKILISNVRGLTKFLNLTTHRGGARVVLIYPADTMTAEAAGSLLKMLEEPRPETYFILATHHTDALLPTILSRCSKIAFSFPEKEEALAWLQSKGVDAETAAGLLAEQGGAPLKALEETKNRNRKLTELLIRELSNPDDLSLSATAEELSKAPARELIAWYQRWLYDLLSVKMAGKIRFYPRAARQLEARAASAGTEELLSLIKKTSERRRYADHPLNARLAAEDMLISYRKIFSPGRRRIR